LLATDTTSNPQSVNTDAMCGLTRLWAPPECTCSEPRSEYTRSTCPKRMSACASVGFASSE
jgi:hypothetical protein